MMWGGQLVLDYVFLLLIWLILLWVYGMIDILWSIVSELWEYCCFLSMRSSNDTILWWLWSIDDWLNELEHELMNVYVWTSNMTKNQCLLPLPLRLSPNLLYLLSINLLYFFNKGLDQDLSMFDHQAISPILTLLIPSLDSVLTSNTQTNAL